MTDDGLKQDRRADLCARLSEVGTAADIISVLITVFCPLFSDLCPLTSDSQITWHLLVKMGQPHGHQVIGDFEFLVGQI